MICSNCGTMALATEATSPCRLDQGSALDVEVQRTGRDRGFGD
jgi:hypothetical protein